jgi:hypothetical protein
MLVFLIHSFNQSKEKVGPYAELSEAWPSVRHHVAPILARSHHFFLLRISHTGPHLVCLPRTIDDFTGCVLALLAFSCSAQVSALRAQRLI